MYKKFALLAIIVLFALDAIGSTCYLFFDGRTEYAIINLITLGVLGFFAYPTLRDVFKD